MPSRSSPDIYAETLAVFDGRDDPNEPLTTPEVAAALDANRRTVYKRLRTLVDRGALETKEAGANARVWWRPPSDRAAARPPRSRPTADAGGRERELRRYETIVETIDDAAFVVDDDWTVTYANRAALETVGTTADAVDGRSIVSLVDEYVADPSDRHRFERALDRAFDAGTGDGSVRVELALAVSGSEFVFEYQLSPIGGEDPDAVAVTARDVTDRKRRERALQARSTAMAASIDGMAILDDDGEYVFVNQAHADVYGYEEPEAFLGETWRICYGAGELARLENEIMPTLREEGAWRGELVGRRKDGTTFPQALSLTATDDGGIVCVVRDVSDREADERALERQRERLAALDELNGVIREITETVIDQSTREEIERVVCERLARSDSYRFAWICAVDPNTRSIEPRAEAGVDGYLAEIPLSVDPDDPTGRGPTGRAALSRVMQVEQDVLESAEFEPWHEYAREYGYRSSAAIPIVHEDTLYGIIGVYSARPGAFAAEERAVVGQLGEVVGHAIAAIDRKRALTSEEVVELEFSLPHVTVLDFLDDSSGTIVFDRIVPVGDGSYIEYGVASDGMLPAVESLVDAPSTPHSGPVNLIDSRDEETRFELRLTDPPVLSAVVSLGGYIDEVRVEDGQYQFRVHLPSGADARPVIRAVTETYPGAELVTRHQTARSTPSTRQLATLLDDRLTERQRAALEAGYFAGFFEWPRTSSGEDVASSLGIGASTFHQHLRKAEKKLLDVVFEEV